MAQFHALIFQTHTRRNILFTPGSRYQALWYWTKKWRNFTWSRWQPLYNESSTWLVSSAVKKNNKRKHLLSIFVTISALVIIKQGSVLQGPSILWIGEVLQRQGENSKKKFAKKISDREIWQHQPLFADLPKILSCFLKFLAILCFSCPHLIPLNWQVSNTKSNAWQSVIWYFYNKN